MLIPFELLYAGTTSHPHNICPSSKTLQQPSTTFPALHHSENHRSSAYNIIIFYICWELRSVLNLYNIPDNMRLHSLTYVRMSEAQRRLHIRNSTLGDTVKTTGFRLPCQCEIYLHTIYVCISQAQLSERRIICNDGWHGVIWCCEWAEWNVFSVSTASQP